MAWADTREAAFFKDVSGQGNHFAPVNLDYRHSVPDVPTNNFATLNPIYHSSSQAVLSQGNLKADTAGFVNAAHGYGAVSTFAIPKDKKIYIEVTCTDGTGDNWFAGFASQSGLESGPSSTNVGGANSITAYNRSAMVNGSETDYGSSAGLGGLGVAKLAAGDILGCMCDGATGKVWFSRNGTYFKSPSTNDSGTTGDPAGGNHEIGTITNGTTEDIFFVLGGNTSVSSIFVNFGQDTTNAVSVNTDGNGFGTFEYAPPTDYLALCSRNLTEPTIIDGTENFNTVLYTGNASARSLTGVGFQPDWVWIKPRSDADNHVLFDSVRGVQKRLYMTGAADFTRSGDGLSAFDADGFSIGDWNNINENSQTYVAWNWKAGGAPSADNSAGVGATPTTNSVKIDGSNLGSALAGTIAAKRISASTSAGVSIVTWTGTGSAGTIAHGLGIVPKFYTVKNLTDSSTSWQSYHAGIASDAETDYIYLNDAAAAGDADDWNDTAPTSSVFSVKTHNQVNASSDNYIAYVFAEIEGYSKIGSYVGNGSTDGTYVHLGFRPIFVLLKESGNTRNWVISYDHSTYYNGLTHSLFPTTTQTEDAYSGSESGGGGRIDFLSNGFKVRTTSTSWNNSGGTFIYLAFADQPFKYSNAR
jgi:hypothetical protein